MNVHSLFVERGGGLIRRFLVSIFLISISLYGTVYWLITAPVWGRPPSLQLQSPVDVQRLKDHVAELTSLSPNRSVHNPKSLNQAARYIEKTLRELGYEVKRQRVPIDGMETFNVRVQIASETLAANAPWIVIGAHYDAALTNNPGADDNASGVAGLLELARLLKIEGKSTQYPLELVFYTTEEPPFFATENMGSAVHALSYFKENKKVRMMYSLEMIGYFSDQPKSQHFPLKFLSLFYPTRGDFIAIVGLLFESKTVREVKKSFLAIDGLKTHSINAPQKLEGIDFSDHKNYWRYGWPAVMITDTAFLRNQEYHLPGDTADRLDYGKMGLVVKAVYQSIFDLH